MSCIRCQNYDTVVDDRPDKVNDIDGFQTTDEGCQSDQDDIGGFASTAGCLHRLRSSEKQVSQGHFIKKSGLIGH